MLTLSITIAGNPFQKMHKNRFYNPAMPITPNIQSQPFEQKAVFRFNQLKKDPTLSLVNVE